MIVMNRKMLKVWHLKLVDDAFKELIDMRKKTPINGTLRMD